MNARTAAARLMRMSLRWQGSEVVSLFDRAVLGVNVHGAEQYRACFVCVLHWRGLLFLSPLFLWQTPRSPKWLQRPTSQ